MKISVTVNETSTAGIIIYDNTAASGTAIYNGTKPAAAAGTVTTHEIDFPGSGVYASTGLYLDITGDGVLSVIVYWDE